jgi:hypothetical protein
MIDISSIRTVIALAGLAIGVLALALKLRARKPKRAEKWEKAEIMKKLLALSEQDAGLATAAPSVRMRAPISKPTMRPGNAHLKASVKTNLPARSKAR